MTISSASEPAGNVIDRGLGRLTRLAAIAFLLCSCWLLWRISMVAFQMEQAFVGLSGDVKQVTTSAAQIANHLQSLDNRVRVIEEKAADAIHLDDIDHLLDEVAVLRGEAVGDRGAPAQEADREIKHLLSHVRRSDHRFVYSNEDRSGTRFYLQLYAKYKLYDTVTGSAEDFIAKVATKTVGGNPYQVVIRPDKTVNLSDWLSEELRGYREARNPAE
jgi:hypothetical protein